MIKVIKQKGNFNSRILDGSGEASLALGHKANTWKTEQLERDTCSDRVNLNRENRVYLETFQREGSKI